MSRFLGAAATRFILRYVGEFPNLADLLVQVKLARSKDGVALDVACPFCKGQMYRESLLDKRPNVREQQYRCDDGHRISVASAEGGRLGWR